MTLPGTETRAWTRARDRRAALPLLLMDLAAGLRPDRSRLELRERLEVGLRRLLPVESVRLCEATTPQKIPPVVSVARHQALTVPHPTGQRGALLEVVSAAGRPLDPWDQQVLEWVVPLCALILELERTASVPGHGALGLLRRDGASVSSIIGSSPAIEHLRERIERVAGTDFTVLIEGESGAGKELVARLIHDLSRRRRGPFVAVNCAALVDSLLEAELFGIEDRTATGVRGRRGKFEHAHGGTLFLDEVSDLSSSAQAKLLRAIQDLAVERVGGQGTHRPDGRFLMMKELPRSQMAAELIVARNWADELHARVRAGQ